MVFCVHCLLVGSVKVYLHSSEIITHLLHSTYYCDQIFKKICQSKLAMIISIVELLPEKKHNISCFLICYASFDQKLTRIWLLLSSICKKNEDVNLQLLWLKATSASLFWSSSPRALIIRFAIQDEFPFCGSKIPAHVNVNHKLVNINKNQSRHQILWI